MPRPPFVPHAEHRVKRTRPVGVGSPSIASRTPDDQCGNERTGDDDDYCPTDTESESYTPTSDEWPRSDERRPAGRPVRGGTFGLLSELLAPNASPSMSDANHCKPCTPRKGYLRPSELVAYDDAPRYPLARSRRERRRCDSVAQYCRGRLAPHTSPSDSVFEPFYNDRATRTMTRDRSHPHPQTGGTA